MLLYGELLDNFYSATTDEEKWELIKEEPIYNKNHEKFMSMLAGTVEKLARDYDLPIPKWVHKSIYTLKEIYYAFNTKNPEFQKYLKEVTPEEYKKRNLFIGENALERC